MMCFKCGRSFASEQSLMYHLSKRKTKCDTYKCVNCSLFFNTKLKLEFHLHIQSPKCLTVQDSLELVVPKVLEENFTSEHVESLLHIIDNRIKQNNILKSEPGLPQDLPSFTVCFD